MIAKVYEDMEVYIEIENFKSNLKKTKYTATGDMQTNPELEDIKRIVGHVKVHETLEVRFVFGDNLLPSIELKRNFQVK